MPFAEAYALKLRVNLAISKAQTELKSLQLSIASIDVTNKQVALEKLDKALTDTHRHASAILGNSFRTPSTHRVYRRKKG